MKIVKVTYTTKAEYAEQNKVNISKVMNELKKQNKPGINYITCVAADGRSFIHTAFFNSEADEKILIDLTVFKEFQQQLKAEGLESAPKQELLTLVGSSTALFTN